jgi:hypothetical protein
VALSLSSFTLGSTVKLTDWGIALHLANDDIERCHLIAQDHEGVSSKGEMGKITGCADCEELATDRCARIQRETCCMLPCTEERVSTTILLLSLRFYADLHLVGDYWNSK